MSRVLVIGSNRGIGLELCKQLAARGDTVLAACRRSSEALDGLAGVEVITGIDVVDRQSLNGLAETLGEASIDSLIVVAGILRGTTLDPLDVESVAEQLKVNALGPLQAVASLLPCLRRGAKVGLLTSRMGSVADNTSGGSYGYRMSKAALNMAGKSLSIDLAPREIAVQLLHPGWVRTEMTGHSGPIDATESAAGLIARIDELTLKDSGRFVHQSGEVLPW